MAKVNRGIKVNLSEQKNTNSHESTFAKFEQIFEQCCDAENEGNVLDLNSENNVDIHKGEIMGVV